LKISREQTRKFITIYHFCFLFVTFRVCSRLSIIYEFTQKIIDRFRRVGAALAGHRGDDFVDDFELDAHDSGDGKSLPAQFVIAAHPLFDVSRVSRKFPMP
jgi:hypothetical protein